MQNERNRDIPYPEQRRREHARHGGAQKTEDEPAEQTAGHDARVRLARIKADQMPKMERPKCGADQPGKHPRREQDPVGLRSDIAQRDPGSRFVVHN